MEPAELYLRYGVTPFPQKLLTRIFQLEFMEINDLLPEAWFSSVKDEATPQCYGTKSAKKKPVPNILSWLQGYASLMSALSTRYLAMVN